MYSRTNQDLRDSGFYLGCLSPLVLEVTPDNSLFRSFVNNVQLTVKRTMLEKLDTLGACLLAVLIAGTFLFFIIAHAIGFKYCKKLFGTRRITQQTQEIPLEGDLFAACYIRTNQPRVLDQHIHHELPAAFLYRWYNEGKLKLVQQKPALEIVNYLSIQKDAVIRDKEENSLYQKFCEASGEDGLLDVDKVYDWSYRHPGDLYGFKPEDIGKEWENSAYTA